MFDVNLNPIHHTATMLGFKNAGTNIHKKRYE